MIFMARVLDINLPGFRGVTLSSGVELVCAVEVECRGVAGTMQLGYGYEIHGGREER